MLHGSSKLTVLINPEVPTIPEIEATMQKLKNNKTAGEETPL